VSDTPTPNAPAGLEAVAAYRRPLADLKADLRSLAATYADRLHAHAAALRAASARLTPLGDEPPEIQLRRAAAATAYADAAAVLEADARLVVAQAPIAALEADTAILDAEQRHLHQLMLDCAEPSAPTHQH
jgi:hypothetical protein